MENFRLLEKRRVRLSIYFALFVLCSTWIIEIFFLSSLYYANNLKIEDRLRLRVKWVENIIKNRQEYREKMESDSVIKSLLEKGLQDVTLVFDDTRILGNIDHTRFSAINAFYEGKEHKYYVGAIGEDREYTVILREYNEYSYYQFLRTIGYFLLFTLPFSLGFYIIGYYFVGKNFKPIREMIESLEDFSANINHELKTPITEIISTLSLSQELGKNHEKAIETSLHSANKLAKILDSMLGIVNLVDSSFQREKVDLIAEIDKIIRDNDRAIQEKGLILRKTFHEKSWTIPINREHLHICVGNILKNAIKYSYDGGTIEIIFKNWVLIIEDQGVGIEEKNLKNIFNRYFRENYFQEEWYGLGLSLVKKITDLHGWDIRIESRKGEGTRIIINFSVSW